MGRGATVCGAAESSALEVLYSCGDTTRAGRERCGVSGQSKGRSEGARCVSCDGQGTKGTAQQR